MGVARRPSTTERALVRSGAAMYAGVGGMGLVESLDGIGGRFSILPALGALFVAGLILLIGARVPRAALWAIGPLGMVGIAGSIAGTPLPTDTAILYALPIMWVAHFYGRAYTVVTVLWLGVVHAWALPGLSSLDRWQDVMGTACLLALATRILTERIVALMEEQRAQARVDPLTGLANRRAFEERHAVDLARVERLGDTLSVAVLDIDHFKAINDEHGHAVGDTVLVRVAEALLGEARSTDTVARMGGEEFAVALPATDLAGAAEFAERVRRRMGTDSRRPTVRISAGIASTATGTAASALVDEADAALYTAKRTGRDRVAVYVGPPSAAPVGVD